MEPVRILHLAPTTERKAERGRFDTALRNAGASVAGAASSSLALAAPFVPGGAVLAAAVKGAVSPPAPSLPGASPGAGGGDLVEATRTLQLEAQSFNLRYLQLQEGLQRESREFTAVSNVMKVRHDTAKSAIQNIH